MKKVTSKIALLALVVLAAGCVKEINDAPPGKGVSWDFWASFETPASKTSLEERTTSGSAKVFWEPGDEINYVTTSNTAGASYPLDITASSESAHIVLQGEDTDTWLYAAYGKNITISACSQNAIELSNVAPANQNYSDFADAHVSLAHAEKSSGAFPGEITFHNLVGMVTFEMDFSKFSIDMSKVHHVVFSAKNGESISGDVSVSFNESGVPVITPQGETSSTITITPNSAKEYYIAMLPVSVYGFQIKFFDQNNVRIAKIDTDKTLNVTRGRIVDLGDLSELSAPILKQDHTDLSAKGTANCYITGVGDYKFKATVRGCTSTELSETPVHAQVLWEAYSADLSSFGVGSIVELADAPIEDGYVYLTTKRRGSALVAVYNADWSKVLWSWHIWVWPEYYNDPNNEVTYSDTYYNKSGYGVSYVMDRNLGADWGAPDANKKTDIRSWGFVYQWGRKDPFQPRKKSFAPSNGQQPNVVASSVASNPGESINYAIEHPTTLMYSTASNKDWIVGTQQNGLWGTTKTESDPCPPGWKIPPVTLWQNAIGSNKALTITHPDEYIGFNFHNIFGNDSEGMIFYPCPGYYDGSSDQTYSNASTVAHYWTSGTNSTYATVMSVRYLANQMTPRGDVFRHYGAHVRCVLMNGLPPVQVSGISLDQTELSLSINQSATLKATFTPAKPTNTNVTWSSSDPAKVSVTAAGKVTAKATTVVDGVNHPVTITVTTEDGGFTATCLVSVAATNIRNLSENGTANCYIVSEPGKYGFRIDVKGNSGESVGTYSEISILWQTDMTASYSRASDEVIPSISVQDGLCVFETPDPLVDGNAVIAVKSGSLVLWSWHIWVCSGFDPDHKASDYQVYYNDAGTVMDRNLGALSDQSGTALSFGLLYQWGRKDPFVGPATTSSTSVSITTYPSPWGIVACSSSNGTEAYGIAHPTTFVTKNSNGDWLYTENNNLWGSTKTMHDPCPPGWRVPNGGKTGLWAVASGETQSISSACGSTGVAFNNILAPGAVWYPFAGAKSSTNGSLTNLQQYGYYWSCNVWKSGYGSSFNVYNSTANKHLVATGFMKANGVSVRCVRE